MPVSSGAIAGSAERYVPRADTVSFEPDKVDVTPGGERLALEPGQNVTSHGMDRNLSIDEAGALLSVVT